jgi:hypothetical protein
VKFLNFSISVKLFILIITLTNCSNSAEKTRAQCLQADSIRADSIRKVEYRIRSNPNTSIDTVKSHTNSEKVKTSINEHTKKTLKKQNKSKDKAKPENSAPRL